MFEHPGYNADNGNHKRYFAYDERHPSHYEWPDEELMERSAALVLDHFLKHNRVVQKKLEIAKEATKRGLESIEKISDKYTFDETKPLIENIRTYENLWDDIIEKFGHRGFSETELKKIEGVLQRIPKVIRVHYEQLVLHNKTLTKIMDDLNSDAYKEALSLAQDIQSRPNPMSNLTVEEYEEEYKDAERKAAEKESKEQTVTGGSYKYVIARDIVK